MANVFIYIRVVNLNLTESLYLCLVIMDWHSQCFPIKMKGKYDAEYSRNIHIYPTPPLGQDMTQGQFFKQSLTGLNSEFSFS